MEPIQYRPTESNASFNPVNPIDYTGPLATEHERLLTAERQVLSDMQRDARTIAANDAERIKGIQEIAAFSTKATEELGQLYADNAVRERKDAFVNEMLSPTEPSSDYIAGRKQAAADYVDGQKVAAEISKVDYEAAEPYRSGSVWAQMGRREAQGLMAVENELPALIQEATAQISVLPPSERDDLVNEIIAEYAESRGLTGFRRSFLEDKILPKVRSIKAQDARLYRLSWGAEDGARREEEIRRTMAGMSPAEIIPALAALPDENLYPIGNSGAWDKFETLVSQGVINGTLPESAYEDMRNAVIPEGNPGAGQKYGKYYRGRFFNIDSAISEGLYKNFRDGENEEKMAAGIAADQRAQSLLNDTEGFTQNTLDRMIADQSYQHQGRGVEQLELLRRHAIDYIADEAATDRLKELKRSGRLSVRLLKGMGVSGDVYDEFYDDAVRLDEAKAAQSSPDFIEDLVKTGGTENRGSVAASVDGSRHYTVGLATDALTRYYNKTLSSILDADPNKSTEQAQQEAAKATLEYYDTDPKFEVDATGYPRFNLLESDANTSNVKAAIAQRELVEKAVISNPGYLDKGVDELGDAAAFSIGELEKISSTYGTVDFVLPEKARTLGRLKGMDPFRVIAKQLKANKMEPLPDSPAVKIFQDIITPEQQRIFNMNPTPASSVRTMGSSGEFKPELVPKGLGPVIQKAATQNGIPPAILAGLLEAESGFQDDVIKGRRVSSSGAIGVAQFLPGTAADRGVDPLNTNSAIYGAAKFIRDIMDGNKGKGIKYSRKVPLETAIYMYNAGPNYRDLSVYPYGEENRNYLPKVMRLAYKYGYKEALDVALVRPAFQ